jgi:hypothetical protein
MPNRVSIARKTSPIPPSPSLLSIPYGPKRRRNSVRRVDQPTHFLRREAFIALNF